MHLRAILKSHCDHTSHRTHGSAGSPNVQLHGHLEEEGVASRSREVHIHATPRWCGQHDARLGTGVFCACMPFYKFSAVRQVIGEGDKPSNESEINFVRVVSEINIV